MEELNPFENLATLINSFKNSEVPEERLSYLNSIKKLVDIGERLYRLKPDKELRQSVGRLKGIAKNYKLYPKL